MCHIMCVCRVDKEQKCVCVCVCVCVHVCMHVNMQFLKKNLMLLHVCCSCYNYMHIIAINRKAIFMGDGMKKTMNM